MLGAQLLWLAPGKGRVGVDIACPEPTLRNSISVKLPPDLDEYVRSLLNKSEWLRQVIAAQVEHQPPRIPRPCNKHGRGRE